MADRLLRMNDEELGGALAGLAPDLAFPTASIDVAALAVARLGSETPEPARRPDLVRRWVAGLLPPRGLRRVLVIALLVVGLTAIAAGAAYVGVRGIQIVFDNGGPTPTATGPRPTSPLPSPTLPGLGDRLELGDLSTLDAARAAADFQVSVPPSVAGLGDPLVFLVGKPYLPRVSFVWVRDGEPALLLTEFRADPYKPFLRKVVFQGGHVTKVLLNGERGYWLSGSAHELDYVDPDGIHFNDHDRLAGDALVWTRGDVTLRLEGASGLAEALRIARATR
jgi:hypothetical protein